MTSLEDLAAVRASIILHEGYRKFPYNDLHGTLSAGYGRNLTREGLSEPEAGLLLDNDLADRVNQLTTRWAPFQACDSPRQRALIELAYQLGVDGLLQFKTMLHCIAVKDYPGAVVALQNSRLEGQAPSRVAFYVNLLRSPVA